MASDYPEDERLPEGTPDEEVEHPFVAVPLVPDVFSDIIKANLLHNLQLHQKDFSFPLGESLHVQGQGFSLLLITAVPKVQIRLI